MVGSMRLGTGFSRAWQPYPGAFQEGRVGSATGMVGSMRLGTGLIRAWQPYQGVGLMGGSDRKGKVARRVCCWVLSQHQEMTILDSTWPNQPLGCLSFPDNTALLPPRVIITTLVPALTAAPS